jgi:hypothetical protein
MGGQRAEDERDGAGVGLDETDARRGERFAEDETGGAGAGAGPGVSAGVGVRTAARTGGEPAADRPAGPTAPAAASGADAKESKPAAVKAGDRLPTADAGPAKASGPIEQTADTEPAKASGPIGQTAPAERAKASGSMEQTVHAEPAKASRPIEQTAPTAPAAPPAPTAPPMPPMPTAPPPSSPRPTAPPPPMRITPLPPPPPPVLVTPITPITPAVPSDGQILGRRLALARQQAGLSIEEVAAATRIRPGMVREIEAGDFIHCGGDVYARGHVRAIAKCVGVDPEPLIEAHPPVVPVELPARPRPRIVARPGASPGSDEATGQAAGAGAGATAAKASQPPSSAGWPASAAVPTSAARDNAARFAARVPSRVIRPAVEGATFRISTSPTDKGMGTGSGPVRPHQPGRGNAPGAVERQPRSANWTAAMLVALLGLVVFAGVQLIGGDSGKHTAAAVPVPAPKPAAVKPPPAPAPPPAPKDVELRLAAIGGDCWLHVVDQGGRVVFDNLLAAGGTQSFKDAKQLGVTFGNASVVHMNLNGKDLGVAGGDGQVVHWTLTPAGAVSG